MEGERREYANDVMGNVEYVKVLRGAMEQATKLSMLRTNEK